MKIYNQLTFRCACAYNTCLNDKKCFETPLSADLGSEWQWKLRYHFESDNQGPTKRRRRFFCPNLAEGSSASISFH